MKSVMRLALVSLLFVSTAAYAGGGKNKKARKCNKQTCAPCPQTSCPKDKCCSMNKS